MVLAIAGGAAVAPSSLDPWIFLLFWVNWREPVDVNNRQKLTNLNTPRQGRTTKQIDHLNAFSGTPTNDTHHNHALVVNTVRKSSKDDIYL